MSQVIPTALAANLTSATPTPAYALRITRTDGQVFGFTSSSRSCDIDGVHYDAGQGLDISSIVTASSLEADNLELTTLDDGSLFTHAQVIGGIWQNARFLILQYDWANPSGGVRPVLGGVVGAVRLKRGVITAELRGLKQYLQQPIGDSTSKTCRARFADHPRPNGNTRCTLHAADWTDACTVGAVTSRRQFEIVRVGGAADRSDDWYGEGLVAFTDGDNAPLSMRVLSFVGGVVSLMSDLPYLPQTGDSLDALAGCRHRLDEDCHGKFSNSVNFQGEAHRPGVDSLTAAPDKGAS